MSKFIKIGRNEEEAQGSETTINLGDDFLTAMHQSLQSHKTEYPLLWRLVMDFYQNVAYSPKEIVYLSHEIRDFFNASITLPVQWKVWLQLLEVICQKAPVEKISIFFWAD